MNVNGREEHCYDPFIISGESDPEYVIVVLPPPHSPLGQFMGM